MKKLLLFVFSFLLMSNIIAQSTDNRLKGLDKELNDILKATKAAGFAVAIVEKNKILYSKGFGYRDYENKIPVDANTLFAIGSSTKAFTASILGQLRNEDKLSFDDSPIKYIPELEFFNDDMNNHIIIKDLMSHRTGLPRHDYSWYLFPTFDKDSLIQRIKYQEPFTGIRQQWYYNNFMFLTQGVIIEHITGKSWEDNIRERFLKPLRMSRTNVTIAEMIAASNAAFGYQLKKDSIISKMDYYNIAAMSPAGSINSSANDMSNWLITWINEGEFKGKEVIPAAYTSEAMSSQMVIGAALPDKDIPDAHFANYGYGWMLSSYKGHYRVEHGGNIDGFSANVAFFPSDSIGIVVLANQNGSSVPGLVRNTIADNILAVNKTDWKQRYIDGQEKAKKATKEAKDAKTSDRIKNTKPSHIKQEFAGTYSHPGYGSFELNVERDSLFALFKLKKFWLKHYHYDVFEPFEVESTGIDTTDSGPLRFNFTTNNTGEISNVKIKVEAMLDPLEFKRKPNVIDVDKETLESYVGNFEIAGTAIKFYIKNETTLYLFVSGQPEYELIPTAKHQFALKALEGFKLEFFEDDNKALNEVLMIQPNGSFKAKRKE
jgi:CubicO group peptidase (beta-lactamase class C family)